MRSFHVIVTSSCCTASLNREAVDIAACIENILGEEMDDTLEQIDTITIEMNQEFLGDRREKVSTHELDLNKEMRVFIYAQNKNFGSGYSILAKNIAEAIYTALNLETYRFDKQLTKIELNFKQFQQVTMILFNTEKTYISILFNAKNRCTGTPCFEKDIASTIKYALDFTIRKMDLSVKGELPTIIVING